MPLIIITPLFHAIDYFSLYCAIIDYAIIFIDYDIADDIIFAINY
jgi:hypothetical protein